MDQVNEKRNEPLQGKGGEKGQDTRSLKLEPCSKNTSPIPLSTILFTEPNFFY
jgi:hypothetical protein